MSTSSPRWSSQTSGRQYWNERGRRFSRSFFGAPTTQFYLEEEQRLFRDYFGELQCRKLLKLDLWNEAQNTEVLFRASQQGAECYGIEIAETTARKAWNRSRALAVPIRIAVGEISVLPFPDNAFDYLYTMGTIEHLPKPEDAFAEIARVLKPGGVAIVGVPNKRDPFLFPVASGFLQVMGRYPYGYERSYTNGELGRQLEAQGLRVTHEDGILFFPWFLRFLDMYLWLSWPSACRMTSLLLEPFRWIAHHRGLVRRFGYLTVCVARKRADSAPRRGPSTSFLRFQGGRSTESAPLPGREGV